MALTISQYNPIRATGTTATSQAVYTGRESVYVKRIHWVAPATAGHLLSLRDSHGNYIATLACGADGVSEQLEINQNFDDIYCDDMDSGTLFIYVR